MRTRYYLISTVIIWAAIIILAAFILSGTPHMGQILAILGGGAAWFIIIAPIALRI